MKEHRVKWDDKIREMLKEGMTMDAAFKELVTITLLTLVADKAIEEEIAEVSGG